MVQRYEQKRRLQWYKRGAAYHRWVKGGEGSATPFTRIITYVLDIYAVSVKGEGCF